MRLGVIGYGVIAETVLAGLTAGGANDWESVVCLARPGTRDRGIELLNGHAKLARSRSVVTNLNDFISSGISLAVECAGHQAVYDFGERVLAAGIDFIPASIGALADDVLHRGLRTAAENSGGRLYLPAGAIGGLDILGAAKLAGIQTLIYTSRKPPLAWRGTRADQLLDLTRLTGEAVFYDGNARAAARDYPKNANVAAAVALAGIGFDLTQVRLIADPLIERNVHEISIRSSCADVNVRIEGRASEQNPQTSLTAGFSIAKLVLDQITIEVI